MHEIHTPPFLRTGWHRGWASMQRDMFASPHAHPQLEPLQAIPATNPFPVDCPAFSLQKDPDSQIAESRAGMREIPNAQPQRGLILRLTLPIPGGPTKLGQPTGPRTTHLKRPMKPLGQFPAAGGPQTFFRKASDNMCLSRERSATSRFNRLFSSSSCRRRRSSLTPRCAYFFFQV